MGNRIAAVMATALAVSLWPLSLRAGEAGPRAEFDRPAVVKAMLDRSRLLENTFFQIPTDLYRQYLRDRAAPEVPVDFIAEEGLYHLTIDADHKGKIEARIHLRVFDPAKVRTVPVLADSLAWETITVNGKEAKLATSGRFLSFTPPEPGEYTIEAKVSLRAAKATGARLALPVLQTVRTALAFDSPGAWDVRAQRLVANQANKPAAQRPQAAEVPTAELIAELHGEAARGTHGRLALLPTRGLVAEFHPPQPQQEHPARYELRGDVNWNLDAGARQVHAQLKVVIAGGASDRIELKLSPQADRVKITGPDVREVNVSGGRAVVYLRGKILGQTALDVAYELPAGNGAESSLGELDVNQGHWAGGTLVVTNPMAGSEVLPGTMGGLKELSLSEVPASARAILPAPAVLAYEITSRSFSAGVEILQLGEFSLRQSIADLAHYELFLDNDGSAICRVRYEIRNRTRQFLDLRLPAGSRVLLARVNEKSCPASEIAPGRWLLPLERSAASVMGLVSFPVEAVFTFRVASPGSAGAAEIPLPSIDLPVAYGWCEMYLPEEMQIRQWSGTLRPVEQFSSETAKASLDYGMSQLAEGYSEKSRPTVAAGLAAAVSRHESPKPETKKPEVAFFGMAPKAQATRPGETATSGGEAKPAEPQSASSFTLTKTGKGSLQLLGKNSYRAGRELYEKGDYEAAEANLKKAVQLAQGTVEADNAGKLLANIGTLQGKVEAKGKSQKAAALEVQKQASEQNRSLEVEQEKLVEQALEDVKAGKKIDARNRLEAAKSIQSKLALVKNGSGTLVLNKEADKQLQDLRKENELQVEDRLREVRKLKEEKRYDEALNLAAQIRDQDGDNRQELKKEMESLAIASVRSKQMANAPAQSARDESVQRELRDPQSGRAESVPATPAATPKPEGAPPPPAAPRIVLDSDFKRATGELSDNEKPASGISGLIPRDTKDDQGLAISGPGGGELRGRGERALGTVAISGGGGMVVSGGNAYTGGTAAIVDQPAAREAERAVAARQPSAPNRVVRTYDVRDLAPSTQSGESAEGLKRMVTEAVDSESWRRSGNGITWNNGTLVVAQSEENQRAVGELLEKLRQARGPQVEVGGKIAQQRASGLNTYSGNVLNAGNVYTGATTITGGTLQITGGNANLNDLSGNRELKDFLDRNYGWQSDAGRYNNAWGNNDPAATGGFVYSDAARSNDTPASGGQGVRNEQDRASLANKLNYNLGQKVVVNSMNLAANREDASGLGVTFTTGNNKAVYGVMDEAQFRSLMELDAARKRSGAIVYDNKRLQETIVGTDARLANGDSANVRFAGESRNDLDYNGNTIALPHQEYLVMDNGGYLTVVRAGPMQFWNEKPADVEFAEVPQCIEVPRVGQPVRLEKMLIPEQSDCLVIRVDYSWKGTSK